MPAERVMDQMKYLCMMRRAMGYDGACFGFLLVSWHMKTPPRLSFRSLCSLRPSVTGVQSDDSRGRRWCSG